MWICFKLEWGAINNKLTKFPDFSKRDRIFHNLKDLKSVDKQFWIAYNCSINGFWGCKIVKCSVGWLLALEVAFTHADTININAVKNGLQFRGLRCQKKERTKWNMGSTRSRVKKEVWDLKQNRSLSFCLVILYVSAPKSPADANFSGGKSFPPYLSIN